MRHSDFAKFYDSVNGLTCHYVPVDETTGDLVETSRDMFITSMNNFGYVGFSREIDNVFHARSTYVYITEAENIIMTCRVTPRPPGTILPFEMGIREGGGSYRLGDDEKVIDINTYTYVRGYYERAMPLLTAGFGYYSKICNAETAYCLYDVENEKIKRAYMSIGFVLSDRFPKPVHFPTFCRQIEGRLEPVRWRVMEWNYETIERQARVAIDNYELVGSA
ncbi:MAG TPA: hypothetical protein VGB00_02515 [Pyrinomonadaceae bacterium]